MIHRLGLGLALVALVASTSGCASRTTDASSGATRASATASAPEPPAPAAKTTSAPEAPDATDAVPPYDLAADRDARTAAARAELDAKAPVATVADVLLLTAARDFRGAAFENSVSLVRRAMAAFLNGRFDRKPDRAITVYLFGTAKTYEAFCQKTYGAPCIAHYGFYEPARRYMVMNAGLGLGTLTHELVHPLVEADFPHAPTWLNEGIASVFEGPVLPRPGEIHGVKNWRHPRLVRALDGPEKTKARLDVLFGMSDATFREEDEDLHYAMARYVCLWLDARDLLWPFYHRFRDAADADPTGAKAFEAVTGQAPSAANAAWVKWVRAL